MDKSQYLKPREYEMMAVLLPDQPEEETQAAIEKVLGYITEQNGTIDSVSAESPWGRRRLAYTIRHEGVDYRDGHYVLAYFTTLASTISDIERELKLDTNVIRYLLLQHDPQMGEKFDESAVAEGDDVDSDDDVAEEDDAATSEVAEETAAADDAVEEAAADEAVDEPAVDDAVEEPAADEAVIDEAEAPAEETSEE